MAIPVGLEIEVTDVDDDYILVSVSAAHGMFAGSTALYSGASAVQELARGLAGFPRSPTDEREVVLGARSTQFADGWVRLLARCVDRSGHVLLDISILDKARDGTSAVREARVFFRVEPAALDRFVHGLRSFHYQLGEQLVLGGAA